MLQIYGKILIPTLLREIVERHCEFIAHHVTNSGKYSAYGSNCVVSLPLFNPSLTFNSPFSLLSSNLRFSFAALCTTNFSWFWFFWRAFSYTSWLHHFFCAIIYCTMIISELRKIIGWFWVAQAKRDIKGEAKKIEKIRQQMKNCCLIAFMPLGIIGLICLGKIRMPDESGNSK